jgi:hypothetical protein
MPFVGEAAAAKLFTQVLKKFQVKPCLRIGAKPCQLFVKSMEVYVPILVCGFIQLQALQKSIIFGPKASIKEMPTNGKTSA